MFLRFKNAGRIGMVGSLWLLACSSSGGANGGAAGSANGGGAGTAGNTSAGAATGGGGSSAGSTATAGAGTGGMTTAGAGAATGGAGAGGSAGSAGSAGSGGGGNKSKTTFFVTSDTSKTGKLGGLDGADKRCQDLAMAAGIGDHTFHAYLSTATVNAKDRIGSGPWVNANGITLAASVAELHSGKVVGDPEIFIDENKMKIHGQWDGGTMVEHDILTGSKADGTVQTGVTCKDWTSADGMDKAQVGHSDGMGPGKATTGTYSSWNSAHASGSCADTSLAGGAGRLYCFAIN